MEFGPPARETARKLMTPALRRSFFMKQLLWVGIGGFLGSIARYKLGGFVLHRSEAWDFPLSTFTVNLLGCFLIGVLAALVERHDLFSQAMRLFLFTGVLGGFTTFSAFAYEGTFLVRRGLFGTGSIYASLSVFGGLTAVWFGMKLIDLVWTAHH
jgi:fluoride exporter